MSTAEMRPLAGWVGVTQTDYERLAGEAPIVIRVMETPEDCSASVCRASRKVFVMTSSREEVERGKFPRTKPERESGW